MYIRRFLMAKKEKEVLAEEEVVSEEQPVEEKKLSLKERLLNFRFLSLLIAIGGVCSAIVSILFLLFFQLSRMYMGKAAGETGQAVADDQVIGFVMFIFAVAGLVIGILNAYTSLPFILNKEKLSPKKSHGWLSLAGGALDLLLVIFSLLNIILRPSTPVVYWVVVMVLGVIAAAYGALLLFPALSVKLYQPKPVVKAK